MAARPRQFSSAVRNRVRASSSASSARGANEVCHSRVVRKSSTEKPHYPKGSSNESASTRSSGMPVTTAQVANSCEYLQHCPTSRSFLLVMTLDNRGARNSTERQRDNSLPNIIRIKRRRPNPSQRLSQVPVTANISKISDDEPSCE
jgi:hypothetical protein